jgi:hypothetical protein
MFNLLIALAYKYSGFAIKAFCPYVFLLNIQYKNVVLTADLLLKEKNEKSKKVKGYNNSK